MFDSTIKVLEMKNMPIPQTIHAIATGPTAGILRHILGESVNAAADHRAHDNGC